MRLGLRERWNLELTLNHEGRQIWGHSERLIVYKGRGESPEHVAMKVLSYLLLYAEGLQIEASADQHYKPDVVLLDDRGEPRIWADCGSTSLRKLDRISSKNRLTMITIVKEHLRELEAYRERAESAVRALERVAWWTFEDHFVAGVAARLRARHEVRASVTVDPDAPEGIDAPGHLFVEIDGAPLDSRIIRLTGDPGHGSSANSGSS